VWLVTSTLLPCASKCPIKFPIVWVLPVPGGPVQHDPCRSNRRAICNCSRLARFAQQNFVVLVSRMAHTRSFAAVLI
jgi:hypothetical protein